MNVFLNTDYLLFSRILWKCTCLYNFIFGWLHSEYSFCSYAHCCIYPQSAFYSLLFCIVPLWAYAAIFLSFSCQWIFKFFHIFGLYRKVAVNIHLQCLCRNSILILFLGEESLDHNIIFISTFWRYHNTVFQNSCTNFSWKFQLYSFLGIEFKNLSL